MTRVSANVAPIHGAAANPASIAAQKPSGSAHAPRWGKRAAHAPASSIAAQ